jgi:hypothetical protein
MYEKDKNGKIFLLIDWVKAFDSVLQRKLINESLKQYEEDGDKDREIETLITYREFFNETTVKVGEEIIKIECGVPQGSSISPFMFNKFLDMALNSNKTIKNLMKQGKILAYADDLIIQLRTKEETHMVIKEFKKLEQWNLKMNKKKS